jgi:hypothetical protein
MSAGQLISERKAVLQRVMGTEAVETTALGWGDTESCRPGTSGALSKLSSSERHGGVIIGPSAWRPVCRHAISAMKPFSPYAKKDKRKSGLSG